MQPEPTLLAYLAGVIDGYITAACSRHKGRLYVGASVGVTGVCHCTLFELRTVGEGGELVCDCGHSEDDHEEGIYDCQGVMVHG